jgi:predicted MFS family arabinose efflux permease
MSSPLASAPKPFSFRQYRAIWICILVANISVWMQNVSAAWLMTSLTQSPLMVALIQTATTLPAFLLGLPGGVLSDQFDRRLLLIAVHLWMLAMALLLFLLVHFDLMTPTLLLAGTFMLGIGSVVSIPAGQASTHDLVPREVLLPAIALNGVAYNAARAIGPALAGMILARTGTATVFLLNSLLFAGVAAIYTFAYAPPRQHAPQPEGMLAAIRSGVRYVRHSPPLSSNILRNVLFVSCASALWALLPLVARQRPGFGAGDYGLLLSSLGGGAVITGVFMGRLRSILSIGMLSNGATVMFAASMLGAAHLTLLLPLCIALVLGGGAWVSFTSISGAAFQTSLPHWVRARALAVLLLAFQGAMAFGAVAWGALASWTTLPLTLSIASALALAGLLVARRTPLRMGEDNEVTSILSWTEPAVAGKLMPEDGPVSIQIRYQVDSQQTDAFSRHAYRLGAARRRNGASVWRLYRDAAQPDCLVEGFIFASWSEYLRQHQRITIADRDVEEDLQEFLVPGSQPLTTHFINHPYPRES